MSNIITVTALEMRPLYKITEDPRIKMFSNAEISIFRSIVLFPRKCSVTYYHSGGKMEMKAHDISNKFITINTFLLKSTFRVILYALICGHRLAAVGEYESKGMIK